MDCHLFLLKCTLKKGEQNWRLPLQKVKKDLINDKQKKQETGTVIKQDILESRHNTIILALGSNLGNRVDNIEKTKFHLSHFCYSLKVSKLYETPSWPNQSNPKFLNLIIECKTDLTIIDLFIKIKKIEILLGRKKSIKNAPRTCDIDIIDFNNSCKHIVHNGKKIITPHPRMHERNFTLIPLYEIKKNWIHPKSKQKIDILIKKLSSKSISDIKIYQTNGIIKHA